VPGSVRIRPEQISAVTDSVPEQQRPDRTITTHNPQFSVCVVLCTLPRLTNGAVEVKRSSCMFVCVYRNCELNCCDISDVHNLVAVGTSLVGCIFFSCSWFFQQLIFSIFQDLIRRRIGCDGK